MRKSACLLVAWLTAGCADQPIDLDPIYAPPPGTREGTNGGPEFSAAELINVMEGNGYLNSEHHQKYEAKARAIVGVPDLGPIKDTIDMELVGSTIGDLTNTTGITVHVKLPAVAFGDFPEPVWRREDRGSTFSWSGGPDVEAHFCIGKDTANGARDQRRLDSYQKREIGAFKNAGVCDKISGYQQKDHAYGDVTPDGRTFATTSVLVVLADPLDDDFYYCLQTGDCKLDPCEGAWALFRGEPQCMPCAMALIEYGEEGPYCAASEEGDKYGGKGEYEGKY